MRNRKIAKALKLTWILIGVAAVMSGTARGQVTAFGQMVVDRFAELTGLGEENPAPISVCHLAQLIDHLDKKLYKYGKISVKSPDVFGQNRMTGYRADFEDQMKSQLGAFELILSAYQRRSDSAALTSATVISAMVQPPQVANSRNVSTTSTTTAVQPPALPIGLSSLFTNANTLVGTVSPDLTPTTVSPSALLLANTGARPGIGLEPDVALDERANYLYHLNQLRRINAGDDKTDVPGYGLYLVRMPVSLLPSRESAMGKGASVTVKARHNLTPDVLPNTFRNVVILDTAYSMMDAINKGLFWEYLIEEPDCGGTANTQSRSGKEQLFEAAAAPGVAPPKGVTGNAPSSEVIQLFGSENLKILVRAMQKDQINWYRHDPSTVSWLLSELESAYGYMREQAHRNHPMFQPIVFEQVAQMVLQRRYGALKKYRDDWLAKLNQARGSSGCQALPVDILSFALIVQSVFLDRQIKYDMEFLAQRKGCACGDPWGLTFYDLYPTTPEDLERYSRARQAFAQYVECKWPIHVFAVDPVVDQQNELDLFSQRTSLQLALAVAVASGQVNFQNATSYARRVELDLETVALNRTAVGFGAGDTTFGWQFYPRIQTPPLQSNPRRIAGILINTGPGPNYDLSHRKIEPGLRECYALVVMPNFVPSVRFTSVANWFDLKTHCDEQVMETTDMVRLSKRLQAAKNGLGLVCDTGKYRPEEVELLGDRIAQLEDMLPLKNHTVDLPFEGTLLGSEIFSSNAAGLAPRLLAWYGEPPAEGTESSIFLLGNGFTVYETHVIAGGVAVAEDTSQGKKLELISRNVMRIAIPANARPKVVLRPDAQGVQRKLIDVHVATPNGISNHLLVEIDPKPAAGAAGAATRNLKVNYAVLQTAPNGNIPPTFIPVSLGVAPANAEVDLLWTAPGTVPAAADATFTFPNPRGGPDLTVSSKAVPNKPGGNTFPLTGDPLNTLVNDLVAELGQLNMLDPQNPVIQLASNLITLTPAGGPAQPDAGGQLIVSFAPANPVAHASPSVIYANLLGGVLQAPNSDVSIDWLGTAANVQATAVVNLTTKVNGSDTSVGTLTFPDNAITRKGGQRVIPKAAILSQLTAVPNLNRFAPNTTFNATITLLPSWGSLALQPVPVTNSFSIILGPPPAAMRMPPSDLPALARRDPATAAPPPSAPAPGATRDAALSRASASAIPLPVRPGTPLPLPPLPGPQPPRSPSRATRAPAGEDEKGNPGPPAPGRSPRRFRWFSRDSG